MLTGLAWICLVLSAQAVPKVTVHLNQPTIQVSRDLYGIFFEEINWAGDGGLYAELVRNRAFKEGVSYWSAPEGVLTAGVNRAKVSTRSPARVENLGYAGMGLRKGIEYRVHLRLRGSAAKSVSVALFSGARQISAAKTMTLGDWQEHRLTLRATETTADGRLGLEFPAGTEAEVDWASMFPGDAVEGIFRRDIFDALKRMNPAFVRFPGGCWVEGETMATAYRWKATLGPKPSRAAVYNLWKYQSTNGLGFHEYLVLCRALGAAPMFVANCGMSHREVVPMAQMDEYVQDVLDAIEYANGPPTSNWGAVRAQSGSAKPFGLKYLEIGNENGGPAYEERYGLIYRAIKAKYPNIVTIANVWGGSPQKSPVEILDEHYYNDPGFFLGQSYRYDRYPRQGPKIYVGEYAVTQGVAQGNIEGALAEAAFMMGMERNSDVVTMSSYAPLLAHPAGKAWNPDLIYFDGLRVVETPSYHVQALFANNRPDQILKSAVANRPSRQSPFPSGNVGVGTWATTAEFRDLRVIKNGRVAFHSDEGLKFEAGNWTRLNSIYRQVGATEGARAIGGDLTWDRYRVELRATKISGAEGFLITLGRKDKDNFIWVNLGGWGNTRHAIERSVAGGKSLIGAGKPGNIETGRTYDIAIDYSPERIVVHLDGEVVLDESVPEVPTLFAEAGQRGPETIVKFINISASEQPIELDMRGQGNAFAVSGTALWSKNDTDTSTFDQPRKVKPEPLVPFRSGKTVRISLRPNSLTILKLRRKS